MENKIILIFAFMFLLIGIYNIDPISIMAGISMLLFLIYDHIYNGKERKNYKVFPTSKFKLAGILGKIDLIIGGLLLIEIFWHIIPNFIIIIFAIILGLKAIPFIFGGDIASIIDIIIVIVILLYSVAEIPSLILILISIYLIQKGVLSLLN